MVENRSRGEPSVTDASQDPQMTEPEPPQAPEGSSIDRLPADFTVNAVIEWSDRLKDLPSDQRPLRIDGEDVDRIGTAGVQLLCILTRDAEQLGKTFVVTNPSETLRRALNTIGLGAQLSVWEANQ